MTQARDEAPFYQPPREEVLLAFAEAIDSWAKVEWQMILLFNAVSTPSDLDKSGSILISIIGVRAQLKAIEAAARVHLREHPQLLEELSRTVQKIGKKATVRNAIVHGRWRESRHVRNGAYTHTEISRVFSRENFLGPVYTTEEERRALLGRNVFDKAELLKARDRFDELARTISTVQQKISATCLPKLP